MQFQSTPLYSLARRFANKALKVVLSLLLVVGFLPVMEKEAEAAESNVRIATVCCSSTDLFYDDNEVTVYALSEGGSLYAWGENRCGQVGDGTVDNRLSPIRIMGSVDSVQASAGTVYALTKAGALYAWGYNECGQVGNGSFKNQSVPKKILEDVVEVSYHSGSAYAVKEDGSLYAWGANPCGQIGDGTTNNQAKPAKVMDEVASVESAGDTVYAIAEDGSLYAWGFNYFGEIGDGTTENRSLPVKVMDGVRSVSGSYAIAEDGSLWAWGENGDGQVGDGTTEDRLSPVKVMEDVVSVYRGGGIHAVTEDGSLWAWGRSEGGALGTGGYATELSPVRIMRNVKKFYADSSVPCAITEDGYLYAWGGLHGARPFEIAGNVAAVHWAGNAVYFTDEGDTLWAQGDGGQYGLGDPADIGDSGFDVVEVMDDVASIAKSYGSSYIVKKDGSLWAWGANDSGQLGDGTTRDRYAPAEVAFPYEQFTSGYTYASFNSNLAKSTGVADSSVNVSYKMMWDDAWFTQDSFEYNPSLSLASMAISFAAYRNTPKNNYRYITKTLTNLGFAEDSIDVSSYTNRIKNEDADYQDDIDKVAYAFATKEIDDGAGGTCDLVCIAVRGTPGNVEWTSNANVADWAFENDKLSSLRYHEGFLDARDEMLAAFSAYIEEQDIDTSAARVLLTGHSRGAAVANMAAVYLGVEDAGHSFDPSRIYAYNFACPRVTLDKDAMDASKYGNVINVVNPEDFVPRIPLSGWGFERYGKTYYLPCKSTESGQFNKYRGFADDAIQRISGTYLNSFDAGADATNKFVSNSLACAPSLADAYGSSLRLGVSFIEYFRSLCGFLEGKNAVSMTKLVTQSALYARIFGYFEKDLATDPEVTHCHTPDTYLAWLEVADKYELNLLKNGQRGDNKKCVWYCPVDLSVYDPDGNLVARIVDDVVDQEVLASENSLAACVDEETGAKSIWIPDETGYAVECMATDSGTLDVTWASPDPEGRVEGQVVYTDLELVGGEAYSFATLSDEDAGGIAADAVSVTDADGAAVEADYVVSEDEAGTLDVSVTAEGRGAATGVVGATKGDHVTVSATPDVANLFAGWYSGGKLVSEDAAYTFRIEESISLEARFVKCEHPNGVKPCEDCGYREIELSDCEFALEYDATTYDGTYWEPQATLTCDGMELLEGQDYTLSYTDNRRAGTATVTATTEGGEMPDTPGAVLLPGSASTQFEIVKAPMNQDAKVTIPRASYVYNGKARKPAPTVRICGVKQLASEYEVTYRNKGKTKKVTPKNVGTYQIRVKAKDTANATGTVWKKFAINPKATANLRLTRLNNGFKASWAKRTAQVTGYQVQYRLKGKTAWTTKWVTSCKTSSKKVTKLKDKKTYQVRVRTYKTVNGVKHYSAWTPIKTVKTK